MKAAAKLPTLRDLFGFSSDAGEHELAGDSRSLAGLVSALRSPSEIVYQLHRAPFTVEGMSHRCRTLVIRPREAVEPALRVTRQERDDAIVIEGTSETLLSIADAVEAFCHSGGDPVRVAGLTIGPIL